MAGIISFVGVSGVGKTSLIQRLAEAHPFALGPEEHRGRPFEALVQRDPRWHCPQPVVVQGPEKLVAQQTNRDSDQGGRCILWSVR